MANPRVFEVAEAEALLPTLVPIMTQIKEKQHQMQKKHDQLLVLELIAGEDQMDFESANGKEYLERSEELESLILSFEDDIVKINDLGCVLKDIERGLVDFFHVRGKELVYLCWKFGEKRITHWHDLEGDYDDRIPI